MTQATACRCTALSCGDKKTGELAACVFSLAVGCYFHDYTMSCFVRDKRSPGAILNKVVGALLEECGYHLVSTTPTPTLSQRLSSGKHDPHPHPIPAAIIW